MTEIAEIIETVHALEARVAALEHRSPSGSAMIVHDKEHDRVIEEMKTIQRTYAAHQSWNAADRARFSVLRARRNELRKLLGIKV